jgi:hypothetical protein
VIARVISWALVVLAMAAVLVAGGCQYGQQRVQSKWNASVKANAQAVAKVQTAQAQATDQVVTQYIDRVRVVRERGADIIKEVPVYVPSSTDSAGACDCALPGGFRVFHDASALGELPNPAQRADAAPVAPQDAAATVATNYTACHANADQLTALQAWVRKQAEVTR